LAVSAERMIASTFFVNQAFEFGEFEKSLKAFIYKLLKGAPVIHLEFKPLIANCKKLLEYKHLEKNQWINLLAPCVALSLQYVALIKKRTK